MITSIPSFEGIFYLCFAWEGKLSSLSCLCVSLPFTLHCSQHMSNSRFQKCQTYKEICFRVIKYLILPGIVLFEFECPAFPEALSLVHPELHHPI